MDVSDPPGKSSGVTTKPEALQCPKCPVVTDTLSRHLRLVHSVQDKHKQVKKKGKCHLCFKEVTQFASHVKGFHKINRNSSLYKHLLQLSRYGFNELAQSSPESCNDSSEEGEEHSALLEKFKEHMMSLDGGLRSSETAVQHMRQIQQIIKEHGLEVFQDIGPLMEKGGYLHKNWKEPEISGRREWRVGTVKSYLYSIRIFLSFCQSTKQHVSDEDCTAGLQRISRWLTSLNKESKIRTQDLHVEEASKLLTVEEISRFYQSSCHQQALHILKNIQDTRTILDINLATLSALRNDLLLWLILTNGPRSGSVLNATVEEFEKATETGDDWILSVRNHKTYSSYGPCHLVMSADLYACLKTWVHVIRPTLIENIEPEQRTLEVFVSNNGKAIDKANTMRLLKAYVEEAIGVSDVTATRIRKSLVALVSIR